MKKNAKIISYILAVSTLLSCVQPVVAREDLLKRARSSKAVIAFEKHFKKATKDLNDYMQCIVSRKGCSRTKTAILIAAILGLLVVIGHYKKGLKEEDTRRKEAVLGGAASEVVIAKAALEKAITEDNVGEISSGVLPGYISRHKLLSPQIDANEMTPLMRAIKAGKSLELIQTLAHEMSDVNQVSVAGKTALDYAYERLRDDKEAITNQLEKFHEAKRAADL